MKLGVQQVFIQNLKNMHAKKPKKTGQHYYYKEPLKREGLLCEGRVDCVEWSGEGRGDNRRKERKANPGAKTKSHQ